MNPNYVVYYHGTATEKDFAVFNSDLVYLAPDKYEAQIFATNFILTKGKKGTPRVLEVLVKSGKVKNISEEVNQVIFEDGDIDAVIEREALLAREQEYRYLEFEHPGVRSNFIALISIFPKDDLTINAVLPIMSEQF